MVYADDCAPGHGQRFGKHFGNLPLKPVINNYIIPGDIPGLVKMLILMGILYLCGALSCYAYNQMMVHISQQVVSEIRSDLFVHTQRLP